MFLFIFIVCSPLMFYTGMASLRDNTTGKGSMNKSNYSQHYILTNLTESKNRSDHSQLNKPANLTESKSRSNDSQHYIPTNLTESKNRSDHSQHLIPTNLTESENRSNYSHHSIPTNLTGNEDRSDNSQHIFVNHTEFQANLRRRRYDYELEQDDNDDDLDYSDNKQQAEPSTLKKIVRNWKMFGLRLVFAGAAALLLLLITAGCCRVLYKRCLACLMKLCPCCAFLKYLYTDPVFEKIQEMSNALGIKFSYKAYENMMTRIEDAYEEHGQQFNQQGQGQGGAQQPNMFSFFH